VLWIEGGSGEGLSVGKTNAKANPEADPDPKPNPKTTAHADALSCSITVRPGSDLRFQWHGDAPPLCFAMASEVSLIQPEALQSRVRELRRFL
jgi:hypothetical protein